MNQYELDHLHFTISFDPDLSADKYRSGEIDNLAIVLLFRQARKLTGFRFMTDRDQYMANMAALLPGLTY